ncbi:High affinity iron permease ftrA [Hyphodiscus hymeniophilus]|uniref:High affinity iron permease ftrA n=1 Tax=Hyphodiscus hymeniophilus TaxID=353542 RepID=A0A9P6VMV5_9HELO|nr:High affinity iron permease ftrA [Hyphodiscus hymeniophilus]
MTVNVFAVPVFFVVFRESLEVVVVVSVLFAFLTQTLAGPSKDPVIYRRLCKQVWLGVGLGLLICLIIGAGMIGAFYGTGVDDYSNTEDYWEGSFAIFASLVIGVLGAALLRVSKMKEKWAVKLEKAMASHVEKDAGRKGRFKRWAEKYVMFILPFVTVLREGLEAIVFIAGVTFSSPASSVPLPVIVGLVAGAAAGYILYKGGASAKLQYFLIISTCLLYLVAAGLFSRGVWFLQAQAWNKEVGSDADEVGSGPGSYDITKSVWHINFGNPELNGGGGWGIFNAVLGWQNSATYGSVISYNVYWIVVMCGFAAMRYSEVHGHWPLMKPKTKVATPDSASLEGGAIDGEKKGGVETVKPAYTVEV